jgi:hypothetical protein
LKLKHRHTIVLVLALAVLSYFVYSCAGSNGEPEKPTATVSPASPATLGVSTSITVSFSTSMDPSTLSLGGTLASQSHVVAWSADAVSNDTLTISPQTAWTGGSYNLSIAVKDLAGAAIDTLSLLYTIDATLPVAGVSPGSGGTIGTGQAITITYSEAMDSSSLQASGSLWGGSDQGVWSKTTYDNDTLIISPQTAWTEGGHTLDVSASDLVGNQVTVNLSYTVVVMTDDDGDGSPAYLDCDDGDSSVFPGAAEICDGKDNDCNSGTVDGSSESWISAACDGSDSDLCLEGTYSCSAGVQTCSDNDAENDLDLCNGVDDDCNAATPDGNDESWFGAACDGSDSDLCLEGSYSCSAGVQTCSDNDADNDLDLCNGVDDDCNAVTPDGSDESWIGDACGVGACAGGTSICSGGSPACSTDDNATAEVCDGLDNDCNGSADFPGETTNLDSDPALSCADCDDTDPNNYPGNAEICDGQDNDCSGGANYPGETTNVDADPALSCADCNDNDATVYPGASELCDGKDNDCDGQIDEGCP